MQRRSKDAAKNGAKMRRFNKKAAKMASAALRVYNIYSPSAAEAIFAAVYRRKIEHLRHLCASLQRSAKMAAKMPKSDPFFRILWGAGFQTF